MGSGASRLRPNQFFVNSHARSGRRRAHPALARSTFIYRRTFILQKFKLMQARAKRMIEIFGPKGHFKIRDLNRNKKRRHT